ncbi:MAG: hypothetical protein IMW91_04550 [Firmicutes bacterium]|nr:hypothetical protein [Bacillota bacterium]
MALTQREASLLEELLDVQGTAVAKYRWYAEQVTEDGTRKLIEQVADTGKETFAQLLEQLGKGGGGGWR